MHAKNLWIGLSWLLATTLAHAQLTALVVLEPTDRQSGHSIVRTALESGLTKASGQAVSVTTSDDLAQAMASTRSGGYDMFIAPAQVAASTLQHGYELVGATQKSDQYLLVGKPAIAGPAGMKGMRLYLPQQDSIYTYMARGMLNQAGLSFSELKSVNYEKFPQAGLMALVLGSTDATVVRADDWELWKKTYPDAAKVLATSQPVPGGFSVVVKKSVAPEVRTRLVQWFTTASSSARLAPATERVEAVQYQRVAELGLFTPLQLPGVQRISAKEAQKLQASGAVVVDTRSEKEYKAQRIRGSVHAAYLEKSLKDVAFNASLDDFKALDGIAQVTPAKPVIFACNGAECWKSYKASKVASGKGFKSVYWLRGGVPEWAAAGLPTDGP